MNLYQEVIRQLLHQQKKGNDIGRAIHYCTQNAFELQAQYEAGESVENIVQQCLDNK